MSVRYISSTSCGLKVLCSGGTWGPQNFIASCSDELNQQRVSYASPPQKANTNLCQGTVESTLYEYIVPHVLLSDVLLTLNWGYGETGKLKEHTATSTAQSVNNVVVIASPDRSYANTVSTTTQPCM